MSDTYYLAERFKPPVAPPVDAERFVRRDARGYLYAVDHRVYLDQTVHTAEMERVFRQQWVFVGMELEVSEPGSFKTTHFGDVPVVIVRDEQGALHVYENICIHRGAVLVRKQCGKARALECLYHRWAYNLKGSLIGVPMPGKFPASFKKQDFKLAELPRVETFSGMIFASYHKDIEPLLDYLGDVKPYVEDVLNKGKIEFLGHQRYHVKANWKLFIENTVDGYHPALLHTMIFADKEYEYEPAKGESRKFSNGHGYLQWPASARPAHVDETENMPLAFTRTRKTPEWDYSINLFPNVMVLRIADIITVRQLIPRGLERVDVITSNFALAGESEELKRHRAWMVSGQFGSAGVASLDDKFAMESVQEAARARYSDTLLLRGEYKNGVGELTTETTLRGFYEKWVECVGSQR